MLHRTITSTSFAFTSTIRYVFVLALVVLLAACESERTSTGPAEKAGQEIDKMVEEAQASAEKAAQEVESTLGAVKEEAVRASANIQESVKDLDAAMGEKMKKITGATTTEIDEQTEAAKKTGEEVHANH
jgi:hyperosmotically inducible periplasmic protein